MAQSTIDDSHCFVGMVMIFVVVAKRLIKTGLKTKILSSQPTNRLEDTYESRGVTWNSEMK